MMKPEKKKKQTNRETYEAGKSNKLRDTGMKRNSNGDNKQTRRRIKQNIATDKWRKIEDIMKYADEEQRKEELYLRKHE